MVAESALLNTVHIPHPDSNNAPKYCILIHSYTIVRVKKCKNPQCGCGFLHFLLTSIENKIIINRDMSEQLPFQRSLADTIRRTAASFPCLLVTGARQVGKSTLLKSMMPEGMRYVTLDDYTLAEQARQDPTGFLEAMGCPLCIDEIQYAPELFRAIKMKVDANRRPGMYWMTGSQRFRLMKNVSDSLAGRIAILELYTFSQREMTGRGNHAPEWCEENLKELAASGAVCDIHELYRRIWHGGYPELFHPNAPDRDTFFSSYVQTYVERDVQELSQVGNKSAFVRLMRSAASRTGQQLVYADLARDADVSPNTAKLWISILETSGIITLLEPYHISTSKRLTKSPKLYFMDTGLCCWLAGWPTAELLENSPFAGAILETWVFGQLTRNYSDLGIRPWLSYYRETRGAEIDFLREVNGGIYPMEVKRSATPRLADLKAADGIPTGIQELRHGLVLCTAEQLRPLPFGHCGFPISAI